MSRMENSLRRGACTAIASLLLLAAARVGAADGVTRCDELVSHPRDPDRVADGVASADVPVDEGITACRGAVAFDPDSPRLHYQLGRVLFYDGQVEQALPHLERSADAGYRQAQFVLGYILDGGLRGAPADVCRTEDLWLRSARSGRLAALISYPHHVVRGRFDDCTVQATDTEMMAFLEQARSRDLDYYQRVLVGDLIEDIVARSGDE
jgi:TPR repeat protein